LQIALRTMAEQTHNTDMSDEPDRQDLEDRVDQLESTISKMLPSRRDALKLGGAALVGGAAISGSASAGTEQAGTIGTANDPVDVESEDINNAETITTEQLTTEDLEVIADLSNTGRAVLAEYNIVNNDNNIKDALQLTNGVSTSFKVISEQRSNDKAAGLVIVSGEDGGDRFSDLLHTDSFNSAPVISSINDQAPASRTYNMNTGELELKMSSGTYTVITRTHTVAGF